MDVRIILGVLNIIEGTTGIQNERELQNSKRKRQELINSFVHEIFGEKYSLNWAKVIMSI